MSAARLPYYQQDHQQDKRRGGSGRGSHQQRGSGFGSSYRRERSRSRSRSRSVERRRYSRSRSRSQERQRRRRHQQQQQSSSSRHHPRDRDNSREREREHRRPARRQLSSSTSTNPHHEVEQQQQPIPKSNAMSAVGAYYNLDTDVPFDKERIHREMEQKLREALAREGKVYPPPKPEPPSHPVFANDGSFMELFKKMQDQQQQQQQSPAVPPLPLEIKTEPLTVPDAVPTSPVAAASSKSGPPAPLVGRRRGGKILKTGVVAKLKTSNESDVDPKDFWSLYLAEVNKYKSTACDTDNSRRPLVK